MSEPAWAFVATASSSLVRGPSARRSATPSVAATWIAWLTWNPTIRRPRVAPGVSSTRRL